LDDAGANVQLIARRQALDFMIKPPVIKEFSNPMWHRMSAIGHGWRIKIFAEAPWLCHYLPRSLRHKAVRWTSLPAGGWFMKDKLEGGPSLLLGCTLKRAKIRDGRVQLELATLKNTKRKVEVEHVIAATGFKADLCRLTFLDSEIQSQLKAVENTPVLSSDLQSSVPGLYFVGPTAANSFGPVIRFTYGAGFAARRLALVLAKR
jgi:hypothetical protein